MQFNVVVVGISAGFALTFFGNTHYATEDLSITRCIPNLTVLSPSDAGMAAKAIVVAVKAESPVYIRLTGTLNCPIVYQTDFEYKIGPSIQLKDGKDTAIFSTGSMVFQAMKAADILEEKGISTAVVDCHTLKPFDAETVKNNFGCRLLVSIEEHNITGGLGTAIAEIISRENNAPELLRLGIKNIFSHPGDYLFLLEQHRLTGPQIAADIYDKLVG